MKRMFRIIVAFSIVLATSVFFGNTALADDPVVQYYGAYGYTITNNEVTIIEYLNFESTGGDVIIPDKINGYPVTKIGDSVFTDCDYISSLSIPNSVIAIGEGTFQYMDGIRNMNISASVTSIGRGAFFGCSNLSSINVDSENLDYSSLDGVLFNKDKTRLISCPGMKLGDYTIPNGVNIITEGAFAYCGGLTRITISNSVSTIGINAFEYCTSLTNIDIPESIKSIPVYCFYSCTNLTNVAIPDSVTVIDLASFCFCSSLTEVSISKNVTYIDNSAYGNCKKLVSITVDDNNMNYSSRDGVLYNRDKTELVCYPAGKAGEFILPNGITKISNFNNCDYLTSVVISDTITTISEYTFNGCDKLASITLPSNIANIASNAVYNCPLLKQVYFLGYRPVILSNAFSPTTKLYYHIAYYSGWSAYNAYPKQAYCLVDMDLQEGNPPYQIMVDVNNNHISEPVAPNRPGYAFYKWYKDSSFEYEWNFAEDLINNDIRVYAKWDPNQYTLTLNYQDQLTFPTTQLVTFGNQYGPLPNPARTGYIFKGWYLDSDCIDLPVIETTTVTTALNHTLYAKWTPNVYTVTFNVQDGTVDPETKDIVFGDPYGELPTPLRSGYNFFGWYLDSGYTGSPVLTSTIVTTSGNHELYANWVIGTYTVTFDAGEGTVNPVTKVVMYNAAYGALPTPLRSGFGFNGWYLDSVCTGSPVLTSTIVTVAMNHTLYAKWAGIRTVTFDAREGTVDPVTKLVTYNTAYGALPTPSRTGYEFDDWYFDSACTGSPVLASTIVSVDMNHTLYAKWKNGTYTVTFDPREGTVDPLAKVVTYSAVYGALPIPLRAGYCFGGWYLNTGFTGVAVTEGTTVATTYNHTLYAKWSPNAYSISFDAQEGSPVPGQQVVYKEAYGTLPQPIRIGYDFKGWFTDKNGTGQHIASDTKMTFNFDHTLYAFWQQSVCKITFRAQGGNATDDISSTYGTAISAPPTPARSGYVFLGWYKEPSCDNAWDFAQDRVFDDTTLYAGWISNIPASLKVLSTTSSSVLLQWDAVPHADGYELLYATSAGGTYISGGTTADTALSCKGLTIAKPYFFKVRSCFTKAGVKEYGGYSVIVKATPLPAAPAVTATSASYNSIRVKWTAVAGATKYELYRSTSANGKYKLLMTTAALNYSNTGLATGTAYYYKVKAYRLVKAKKIYGSYSAICKVTATLPAPATIKARASSTSVKLSWSSVPGRTKYEIWRRDSAGGAFKLVGTTTATGYTNAKLAKGHTYYYKVRAYHLEGRKKVYGGYTKVVSSRP